MRRRAWPFLLLFGLLVGAASPASPPARAAERPPPAELRAGGDSARLAPWTYSWRYPSGQAFCGAVVADGFPGYGPRLSLPHRHARPRVVFLRDRRPHVSRFRAYSEIGDGGTPVGRGKRVRSVVRPKRRRGEVVGWAIAFRVDVVARPYFDLDVSFRPRGRCGEGGSGSYSFGLERE